jgi:hypothetical protein
METLSAFTTHDTVSTGSETTGAGVSGAYQRDSEGHTEDDQAGASPQTVKRGLVQRIRGRKQSSTARVRLTDQGHRIAEAIAAKLPTTYQERDDP